MTGVSVVVPTLNEEGNIGELIERVSAALERKRIPYEIICVDDHSEDGTQAAVMECSGRFPVRFFEKQGRRGKAQSLLEGFGHARYEVWAFIDGDLQYPPEALGEMWERLEGGADVVVTRRREHPEGGLRAVMSSVFMFLFVRLLHGLQFDVQSGLKMFRRQVLEEMVLAPSPWTFDLAFLVNAREQGHVIESVDIDFAPRKQGRSKIAVAAASWEIARRALALRFSRHRPKVINPLYTDSSVGAGISHRRQRFITHTVLDHASSAFHTVSRGQAWLLWLLLVVVFTSLLVAPFTTVLVAVAILSAVYFVDVFFNLYLVRRSLLNSTMLSFSQTELESLDDAELPTYTILCPLYREARVLPHFLKAIRALDWPKGKLDVQLLLEEDDTETLRAVQKYPLAKYVRVMVVPHSQPKTKPKACNFGLAHAKGEFVVIYDAEDVPDPQQLRKAYLGFLRSGREVKCLQAKLNYYNPDQNFLTRLFTAEYSLWFDVMLTGMQSLNTTIPLGGTSNHFRTADLRELQGWDPFNVTEDCDLGARLFRLGHKTAVIDSVTLEEANSRTKNWIRQRSRWLKGYMQTYLVHMRSPWKFVREQGWHALAFQFIVGGKVLFILVNPLMWGMTLSYFLLNPWLGEPIEALYPTTVFTMAAVSTVFGNFLQVYYYMIGVARREQWHLMKYVWLVPVYWVLTSVAGYIAFYQLLFDPFYWEKTEHGLGGVPELATVPAPARWSRRLYSRI